MNNDYVFVVDSACDFSEEQMKKSGAYVVPMEFQIDGKVYKNHPSMKEPNIDDFYLRLKAGADVSTSQANISVYEEFFEPFLQDGKDILCLGFSSGLSGTYSSSVAASKDLLEKYPERRIECIDSKAASSGYGLFAYLAGQKKNEGESLDQVKSFIEHTRDHLCHWFTVDDLGQLKRGGRISSATALFGGIMGIKPVMHVDNDGFLRPVENVRGRKASINKMFEHMKQTAIAPQGQTIFIAHAHCIDDAKYLAKLIKSEWHTKDIQIGNIGPVIGAHSGYGTLALFFIGSEK